MGNIRDLTRRASKNASPDLPGKTPRPILLMIVIACLWTSSSVAAPWDIAKQNLKNHGVDLNFRYDGDIGVDVSGGKKRGATYSGLLNLQASLDGDRLAGLKGISVFFNGLVIHGRDPSDFVGDAQELSNIAAPASAYLYQAWIQYVSDGKTISILAGRYDVSGEFYQAHTAGLFMNSSFGIGPDFSQSGAAGPSIFPYTALGARVSYRPIPRLTVRAAILDGAPIRHAKDTTALFNRGDGVLLVSELDYHTGVGNGHRFDTKRSILRRIAGQPPYHGKIAFGVWHYTATFSDLSTLDSFGRPVQRRGSSGAYAVADFLVYRREHHPRRYISSFLQFGIADERTNRFSKYVGIGAVAHGFVPHRPLDQFGLAAAIALNGSHYLRDQQLLGDPANAAETSIELTYLTQLRSWFGVQTDAQYIINPNTDPAINNALAFQIKFEASF